MRILLTGRSGQVGSAIGARLSQHDVVAPGRDIFDLRDVESIRAEVGRIAPHLIVNCAAYTAVDAAEDDAQTAQRVNAEAVAALAEAACATGAGMLHFSTDYVFDGSATRPYRESDRPAPLNAYGRSKLDGERALRSSGVAHLILRTSWVYAADGKNFLRTMLRLFAERDSVAVVADQTGAPTPAPILADIVAALIDRMADDAPAFLARHGGILNVACRGATTWHGFASAIRDTACARGRDLRLRDIVPIASKDYPTKARRPAYSVLDLQRLEREFALTTPDWRVALDQVFDMPAV